MKANGKTNKVKYSLFKNVILIIFTSVCHYSLERERGRTQIAETQQHRVGE